MPRLACALALLFCFAATPGADQKANDKDKVPPLLPIAPLDLHQALNLYAAGRFDEAVQSVARAGTEVGRNLRRHWAETGYQWINADPAHRGERILAAAALALETEHLRAERGDWRVSGNPLCAAACVLDWAQLRLVERGAPDQAERAWFLAAAALGGGVRDWRYLQRTVDPARAARLLPGLMDRALARFPNDPALRLEQGLAAAGRFNVVVDGGRLADPGLVSLVFPGGVGLSVAPRAEQPDAAVGMLSALVDDPRVGAEARLRLGYLNWVRERGAAGHDELTKAAAQAQDPDVRYLAHFIDGWIAIERGDSAAAIPRLEAALAARPGSQSAAVALASLELQRGDADKAHEIARASLDQRRADVDPWRLFLYGHHPQWSARVADLRRAVKP